MSEAVHWMNPKSTSPLRSRVSVVAMALAVIAMVGTALAGAAQGLSADASAGVPLPALEPMTTVDTAAHTGYFSDPYPIHVAPWLRDLTPQAFSGTTKDILTCPGLAPAPACFRQTPFTVTVDEALVAQAARFGTQVTSTIENSNIYQSNNGELSMAATLFVKNPDYPNVTHWNVIVHAHPTDPLLPLHWVADSVLVGSFQTPARANYDGKYFEDAGRLYLVYSKRLSGPNEPAHDGIVAQLLQSPAVTDATPPVPLLGPDTVNNGFNSELFFVDRPNSQFKLIETGNITRIGNKYVMAYSTGDYQEADYKAGLAYSDTFLPVDGGSYKRVLAEDPAGVWGQPGHDEVVYLLQAEKENWPNYVRAQVLAPGVPSVVQDKGGAYYLYFAAYMPGDAPHVEGSTTDLQSNYRRPYFVKLNVNIPPDATVASTPNAALVTWITTVKQ